MRGNTLNTLPGTLTKVITTCKMYDSEDYLQSTDNETDGVKSCTQDHTREKYTTRTSVGVQKSTNFRVEVTVQYNNIILQKVIHFLITNSKD